MPAAEGQRRFSPALLLVMLVLVVVAIVAFVMLRANGGHPGEQPATHSVPAGSPSK